MISQHGLGTGDAVKLGWVCLMIGYGYSCLYLRCPEQSRDSNVTWAPHRLPGRITPDLVEHADRHNRRKREHALGITVGVLWSDFEERHQNCEGGEPDFDKFTIELGIRI